jgi:MmyB-like transcription regulator ligand binding domain
LDAHDPYPGMVLDCHWNVLAANPACVRLLGDLVGGNLVRLLTANQAAAHTIVNWPDVAWAGLARLRRQLDHAPHDVELRALVELAETAVAGVPSPGSADNNEPVLCPCFRVGDRTVRTIGMAARFDPVTDVTLDELRVELIYPLDAEADVFFRDLGSPSL